MSELKDCYPPVKTNSNQYITHEDGIRKIRETESYKKVIEHRATLNELKLNTWTCPSDTTGFQDIKLKIKLRESDVIFKGESDHPVPHNTTYRCDFTIQVSREDGSRVSNFSLKDNILWNPSHTFCCNVEVECDSIMVFRIIVDITKNSSKIDLK